MKNTVVKIRKITVNNIKNVKTGDILFPFYASGNADRQAEIIGLYGQNGSGKTALINALFILKCVMGNMGDKKNFKDQVFPLINIESPYAKLSYEFSVSHENKHMEAVFSFKIEKTEKDIRIFEEKLQYRSNVPEKKTMMTIMETSKDLENAFLPKSRLDELVSKKKTKKTDLIVSRKLADEKNESFIFRQDSIDIFDRGFDKHE